MAFYVGQKVVCVGAKATDPNALSRKDADGLGANYPNVGSVYTIRAIRSLYYGETLLIDGVDNSHLIGFCGFVVEPGFTSNAFRPIQERKHDLSIFYAILNGYRIPVEA